MGHNFVLMILSMVLAGLLSSMYVWADRLEHVFISLNDIYMIILMIGWKLLFMQFFGLENYGTIGFILILVGIYCIRKQLFISKRQYAIGMIPHHSMAIYMSKKLLEKDGNLEEDRKRFLNNLINLQEDEIKLLKKWI